MRDEFPAAFDARLEREKLESLKELAYGASHEINNPLANIAARAQSLLTDEADPERRRKLAAIHRQAMRAHEMISDLMLFARPPKLNRQPCILNRLLERVVAQHREFAAERGQTITFAAADDPHPELHLDETQIAVAVDALVKNSIEAAGHDGTIEIIARTETPAAGDAPWVEIIVRDDGPGIPPAVRPHIFDPFYSGREAGRGLGFGLSKCWRIVTEHGGEVTVAPSTNSGAEFTIRFPAAAIS